MCNEFGHPEWIDFPREGNNWSFKYARRQWHLVDDVSLKYHLLARFDHDMIALAKTYRLFDSPILQLLHEHSANKVIIFRRDDLFFAFNFHQDHSYTDYRFETPPGNYQMILDCDAPEYGGHGRLLPRQKHFTITDDSGAQSRHMLDHSVGMLSFCLPSRSAFVFCRSMV
jgi:1,4-alpha-glucan branching enzyme